MTQICCITLSRNQGKFLEAAIESVLEQEGPIDYLIYDVASTDETAVILGRLQSDSLQILEVLEDAGPADGLNRGLALIRGEIFYYLNADDRVLPGAFAFARDYFEKNPSCHVLHGSIILINEFGNKIKTLPAIKFSLRGYAFRYAVVYQQATFIRTTALSQTRFNIANRTSWDGELIVDLAAEGYSIHRTRKILGEFRIHDASITGSGRLKEETLRDHKRLFHQIMGREWNIMDAFRSWILRKTFGILRRIFVRAVPLLRVKS